MAVKTKVIRSEEVLRGVWSGGTTAEYYSWPSGSAFERRDFAFSICSATVDLEESTFTDYTGYDRVIMSISNGFALSHDGSDRYKLDCCQPHAFTGEALTRSYGRYEDLNLLMNRSECAGYMCSYVISGGSTAYGPTGEPGCERIEAIFCAGGDIDVSGFCDVKLKHGDLLVLEGLPYTDSVKISSASGGSAVICEVKLRKVEKQ